MADYAKYREIMKEFIEKNPRREVYMAAGWFESDEYVTKAYLDDMCPDKPLIMNTSGGHSMLLNSKALEWAGIDKAYAEKHGSDEVHVDESCEPDGYICEAPVLEVMPKVPKTFQDPKDYLLAWQDIALKIGYTGSAGAGVEIVYRQATRLSARRHRKDSLRW